MKPWLAANGWWKNSFGNSLRENINSLRSLAAQIIFPIFCVGCGREGEWWCVSCRSKTEIILKNEKTSEPLDGLLAFFDYDENQPVAKLIRTFKYGYAQDIETAWRDAIQASQMPTGVLEYLDGAVMVPIPLHPRRERERGFNQAHALANIFYTFLTDKGVRLPALGEVLKRNKYTQQQAKLGKDERADNVRDAFVVVSGLPVANKVILVDDVYTTGSTMRECARVLKESGVKSVIGMVLAKAV